jgi:type II secretory pathway pseudopilin PulG
VEPKSHEPTPVDRRRLTVLFWIQIAMVAICAVVLAGVATAVVRKAKDYRALEASRRDLERDIKSTLAEKARVSSELESAQERLTKVRDASDKAPLPSPSQDISEKDLAAQVDRLVETKSKIDAVLAEPKPAARSVSPGDVRSKLQVRLQRSASREHTKDGRPLYQIQFSVTGPSEVLQRVASVRYFFDHPTFVPKTRVGSDAKSGFSISYLGWGCIQEVGVTAVLRGGEEVSLPAFPFCDKW